MSRIKTEKTQKMYTENAWGQQPNETTAAFALFCTFRDLGPGRKVTEMAGQPVELLDGKKFSEKALYRLSQMHQWKHRAAAYDRWLDRKRQSAQALAAKKSARKQLKSSRAAQSICYRHLMYTVRKLEDEAQFYRNMDSKDLLDMSQRLMKSLKDLQDMDRRAFGEPDQIIELTGGAKPGFFDDADKDIMKLIRTDSQAMELWTKFMYRVDELRDAELQKKKEEAQI